MDILLKEIVDFPDPMRSFSLVILKSKYFCKIFNLDSSSFPVIPISFKYKSFNIFELVSLLR